MRASEWIVKFDWLIEKQKKKRMVSQSCSFGRDNADMIIFNASEDCSENVQKIGI